jgi:hypothetical protein
LYVPGDGGFAPAQTSRLSALLAEARRAGVPIRVALIATRADLGSVTELWGQPQNYARFLGQELSQIYRGTIVVEMPRGEGVYQPPPQAPGISRITVGLPEDATMIEGALTTVHTLAYNAGHRLPLPRVTAASGLGSWLSLAAGAALIALAWTASLRARGLG